MHPQKQRRKRGVVLTPQGLKKLQTAKFKAESCENNERRYTLEDLSIRTGLDPDTLMKVFTCETGVDKRTLDRCFRAFNLLLEQSDYDLPPTWVEAVEAPSEAVQVLPHWGEAPDVSVFYGRTEEIATLRHWILNDRCRLVTLLSMGGMGKTYLSVKLAQQIQDHFDFIIWRSLLPAPPVQDLLGELISFLSNEQETDLPTNIYCRISRLIHYLQARRCLLILDKVETILQGCATPETVYSPGAGSYSKGYEDYGQLFQRVGEAPHQSCLVLTSREKPREIRPLEGATLPVRVLQLKGLQVEDIQQIFQAKGCFHGSTTQWHQLIDCYAGNPLVLKIASTTIHQLFAGSISEFLEQKTAIFGDILYLLEQQFNRLSHREKEIIKWLVLCHKPVSFSQLRTEMPYLVSPQQLLETLESLEARCLIDKATPTLMDRKSALFSLQPVVMEYATYRLIEQKSTEDQQDVFFEQRYQIQEVSSMR